MSGEMLKEIEVMAEMDNHRLDFIISRELNVSRNFAQELIKSGKVTVVGTEHVKPSLKLHKGDRLKAFLPKQEQTGLIPEKIDFEVVYEDNDIIVINKPAGLVVHPAPGHWTGTLVHGLLHMYPDMLALDNVNRPGIVHRLDSTTSGLMVIARNGLAHEKLTKDFRERRVHKEYIALCYDTLPKANGSIKYPIDRDPYCPKRMAIVEDGRDAHTDYSVLWTSEKYSLVKCVLHTGRTHQIRVHLASIRCPIVGDKVYANGRHSSFGTDRVFLHAWTLSFKHPRTGEQMSFTQPLPVELTSFLQRIPYKVNCQHEEY